jgi:hypothetical protein
VDLVKLSLHHVYHLVNSVAMIAPPGAMHVNRLTTTALYRVSNGFLTN